MAPVKVLNVGYDSTNYYLLVLSKPLLLVDVGWPKTLPKLEHALQRYGFHLKDIPYMLATHFHPDHAGLVEEAKEQGVELLLMDNQLASLKTAESGKLYIKFTPTGNVILRPDESRSFLVRMGLPGEIIATPGHSDDSVTLVLDEGLAFTGDLHPVDFATEDQMEKTIASWDKIHSLGVHTIYPGHGPVRQVG